MTELATIDQWATKINKHWRDTVRGVIETGSILLEAKENLQHGQFGAMCQNDLLFSASFAQKLMAVARSSLANADSYPHLPASVTTLYELAHIPDDKMSEFLRLGSVTPDMDRAGARKLRKLAGVPAEPKGSPAPSEPVSEGFEPVENTKNVTFEDGTARLKEQVATQPEPGSVIEPDLPPLSSGLKEMAGLALVAEDVTMVPQDRLDLIGKIDGIWETKVSPAMTALQRDLGKELD